jgi:[ribosomal protein S5]-alanine N-acetyltransferase
MVLLATPIRTAGLVLRSLDVSHAGGPYAAWMRDEDVTRYLEVRFAPPDRSALEEFIRRMNESTDNLLLGLFPAADPQRHIGNIKLGPIDPRHSVAAIGVLIGAKEYWGKGLAGEAVAAVAEYGFASYDLERVEAGFYAENEASQRAFKRAGFVEEGRRFRARRSGDARTDEIIMGRLREQHSA